jgi:hypothetical protein
MTRRSRQVWRRSYPSLDGLGPQALAIEAIGFEYADQFLIVNKPAGWYVAHKAGPLKTLTRMRLLPLS